MEYTLDKVHKMQLEVILSEALTHAQKCVENESPHTASEWMCVVTNADHILRKHCNEVTHSM